MSLDIKRKFSQGMAVKDVEVICSIFYLEILKGGPMGNDEMEEKEEEKQVVGEENNK